MSLTFRDAKSVVFGVFDTHWVGLGYTYDSPDLPIDAATFPPEDTTTPWARARMVGVTGGQGSLANASGDHLNDRTALMTIQVFTPRGKGETQGLDLAQGIVDVYQSATNVLGLFYLNVRHNEIGASGAWYQINVLVEVAYSQVGSFP